MECSRQDTGVSWHFLLRGVLSTQRSKYLINICWISEWNVSSHYLALTVHSPLLLPRIPIHLLFKYLFYLFFIWLRQVLVMACGIFSCGMQDLVPQPETDPRVPAWGAQSLSHWATREVLPSPSGLTCFCVFLNPTQVFPLPGSLPGFSESGVPPLCPTGTQPLPSSLQSSPWMHCLLIFSPLDCWVQHARGALATWMLALPNYIKTIAKICWVLTIFQLLRDSFRELSSLTFTKVL